ncbi:TRC40/GET3/ArsA family transport-energizing ATPase [Candidatus Desantisbacteria bacterium]|nr:TRC40/GET3/ArsA family transport-energizing ATPase [Candidatus Desantisbacteria bacterium]
MNLKELLNIKSKTKYIMFGGKGGLGKTTFSAACGYYLAKKGYKVLVFSVDPQASLSDIFKKNIFGKGATEIMPNLFAQEIDADERIKQYQKEIKQKILDRYGLEKVPEEVETYIKAASAEPAMEESAIFDAVVDIVFKGDYDYYIYDLVPLGHALYYLSMTSIYDEWINKITDLRTEMHKYDAVVAKMRNEKSSEEDEILNELLDIKKRINLSSSIFTDKEKTGFFFVLTPEEMTIFDTIKAKELFSKFGVPISGYVVNRVIPSEFLTQNIPDYLRNRIISQQEPLNKIRTVFCDQIMGFVPEFEQDITGLDMIEKVAQKMFGDF